MFFESRVLGLEQNYRFFWLSCELTAIAFSGNWPLETILRLARCKVIKTISLARELEARTSNLDAMKVYHNSCTELCPMLQQLPFLKNSIVLTVAFVYHRTVRAVAVC